MWLIKETDRVARQFKKLGEPERKRFREAVKILSDSKDPRKLGTFKRGAKHTAYYYELGRSFRLAYQIIDKEVTILLLDIGDHKEIYGKD